MASNSRDSSSPPPSYNQVMASDANNFVPPPMYHLNTKEGDDWQEAQKPSDLINVRVVCPSIKVTKIFHFSLEETVWDAKMKVISEFNNQKSESHLHDALNFGFYISRRGQDGMYLNEQGLLKDHPFANVDLEFRPKRRIYSNSHAHGDKILHAANSKESHEKCMKLISSGNVDGIKRLLQSGLDPNIQDEEKGYYAPLIHAAKIERCSYELLKVLVEYGAHLDIRSSKGETAVHIAAAAGNITVLEHLLMADASLDYRDGEGLTPLYRTICGRGTVVEYLLTYGAAIGISDIDGYQEIHQACRVNGWGYLKMLITRGADVNCVTKEGDTPLHLCAQNNDLACARILLDHGANVHAKNHAQLTPYDICFNMGYNDLASQLQPHGDTIINDSSTKDENLIGRTTSEKSLNLPKKLEGISFTDWSCDEVCLWLEHLELGEYKDIFVSNTIKGKHLLQLSRDEMKELGITKLGDRMTLEDEISKLKSSSCS